MTCQRIFTAAILLMSLGTVLANPSSIPKAFQAEPTDAEKILKTGTTFAEGYRVGEHALSLRGTSQFRVLFWSVFDAALYTPRGLPRGEVLKGPPNRLEFVYHRAIASDDFIKKANEGLGLNLSREERESIHDRIQELHKLYSDVKPGDRYALTFVPGKGTVLTLNGRFVGRIKGDDFAPLYFRIWLGKQSPRRLREKLLESKNGSEA